MTRAEATIIPSEHDARHVANYIIRHGINERSTAYTSLAVIKLVYLVHGWMLGLHNRAMFAQTVRAWKYGPVISDVYHCVKGRGGEPFKEPLNYDDPKLDDLEKDLIGEVLDVYKDFSGVHLSALTHQEGTPWYKTWNEQGHDAIIPNTMIRDHYREKSKANG